MAFTEDRAAFFNVDELAVAGLYNGTTTVNGIFDLDYADVIQSEYPGVSSGRPAFRYNLDDIPAPTMGASMVIEGVSYLVRDSQPTNDIGMLYLEEV